MMSESRNFSRSLSSELKNFITTNMLNEHDNVENSKTTPRNIEGTPNMLKKHDNVGNNYSVNKTTPRNIEETQASTRQYVSTLQVTLNSGSYDQQDEAKVVPEPPVRHFKPKPEVIAEENQLLSEASGVVPKASHQEIDDLIFNLNELENEVRIFFGPATSAKYQFLESKLLAYSQCLKAIEEDVPKKREIYDHMDKISALLKGRPILYLTSKFGMKDINTEATTEESNEEYVLSQIVARVTEISKMAGQEDQESLLELQREVTGHEAVLAKIAEGNVPKIKVLDARIALKVAAQNIAIKLNGFM